MTEEKFRVESDLLGELKVPDDALYGVQTQRGINNYHISRKKMRDYPDEDIAIKQAELNAAYDAFTDAYGLINSSANAKVFQE